MPAVAFRTEPYWRCLNATERPQLETLQENVTRRMEARVIPDHAHSSRFVAHRQARKVIHGKAVVARDHCEFHRVDAHCISIEVFGLAGRSRSER